MDKRERIAKNAALLLHDGDIVNLGLGIPGLVPNYIGPDKQVFFHNENGSIGLAGIVRPGEMDYDPELIDACANCCRFQPGGSVLDSAASFAFVRSGRLDVTVLGAMEVDETGGLANWAIPGKMLAGMGGAMDLVSGAKRVIVAMEHCSKAAAAQRQGKLGKSIIPVTVKNAQGEEISVTMDEGIRPDSTMETLSGLKPCFLPETGRVTAATSSQTSDGAAFVLLMERTRARALGLRPIARLRGFATAGCDATLMGLGPVYAVPKALKRAGLSAADMDDVELNEAFAAQAIPCIRELKLDPEKVNPYGGAIALGHPMGATGAVLICKLLDYLADTGGRFGLVTMCIGGGMGAAGVFELL